jgi:hypothetical protein
MVPFIPELKVPVVLFGAPQQPAVKLSLGASYSPHP